MRNQIAFSIVLALVGSVLFLAGCLLLAMRVSGSLEAATPALQTAFVAIICIEFAVFGLIAVALTWRFLKGSFSIGWTDAAILSLTAASPPMFPITLWWYLLIRRNVISASETIDA
jgi:hypothetical protein